MRKPIPRSTGTWVLMILAVAAAVPPRAIADQSTGRPNIVVILADDLGYGDIGVHGCQDIPTPHIDSIAANGIRCSSGYVSCPHCAPSRAALLTGRYQQRFGYEYNGAFPHANLPLSERTIADRLNAAGYTTGVIGKWHLGTDPPYHPLRRGFDEFFGFVGGANHYLPAAKSPPLSPIILMFLPKAKKHPEVIPAMLRGTEPVRVTQYLTDVLTTEAVSFIDRHQKKPFFLYLAYNAVHRPLQAPPKYLARFKNIKNKKRRIYAAMLSAMDDGVGKVLNKLKSAGLEKETLVFFLSDHGGPGPSRNGSHNTPLRGYKGELREGGIRVPFLIQWPGHLPAGTVYEKPVIQMDISATALALAGVDVPTEAKLDGVNLLPYLKGMNGQSPHDALYWRFQYPPGNPDRYKWAIRKGNWKLFTDIGRGRASHGEPPPDDPVMLVNLAQDIDETENLAQEYPKKVKSLRNLWEQWNAQLQDPGTLPKKNR